MTGATPHQLLYGSLRRCVDSGDIAHLALCRKCRRIFYRKSLKGEFCSDECRWSYFNGGEDRKSKRRKGGDWYLHNEKGNKSPRKHILVEMKRERQKKEEAKNERK